MENIIIWGLPVIEWIGYLASLLVLISLSLASIVRLRIYNLMGAAVFSFYGFYIDSLPVGIMNLIIVFFNIYHLRILFFRKERFDVVQADENDTFLRKYLNHRIMDIHTSFPDFKIKLDTQQHILLILRNMNVAGVFICTKPRLGNADILLDYVDPKYRDYKIGKYLYVHSKNFFLKENIKRFTCQPQVPKLMRYLKKMGFSENGKEKKRFELKIA